MEEELLLKAFNKLIEHLEKKGNRTLQDQQQALYETLKTMLHLIVNEDATGRYAIPILAGGGKTTSVCALAYALQDTKYSLLIAAERVENQLWETYNTMVEMGVSPDLIGMFHTKDSPPSIDETDLANTQFLLASHSRVKGWSIKEQIYKLNKYRDGRRSLVLWDESLVATSTAYYKAAYILDSIALLESRLSYKRQEGVPVTADHVTVMAFYSKIRNCILQRLANLDTVEAISEDYIKVVNSLLSDEIERQTALGNLIRFLNYGTVELADKGDEAGQILITFRPVVASSLDKVVVLDASTPIKRLVHYDKSIEVKNLEVKKDHSGVKVRVIDSPASKTFYADDQNFSAVGKEIKKIIRQEISPLDNVLFVCHKFMLPKVETYIKVNFPGEEQRFSIIHWNGNTRASNGYANHTKMIIWSALYRDEHEIAAKIIGQTSDRTYRPTLQEVRRVSLSETAEALYQAINRMACRKMVDGKAERSDVWMFLPSYDSEDVLSDLVKVMPAVQITHRKPTEVGRKGQGRILDVRREVESYLMNLPSTVVSRSTKALRKDMGLPDDLAPKTLQKALCNGFYGWEVKGRSLVRLANPW